MINLGDKVKDKVTGLVGIVIGRTEFLYGCTRVGIQSEVGKDGKVPEAHWFDEPQLTLIKAKVVEPATKKQRDIGGPMVSIPTRNKSGSR